MGRYEQPARRPAVITGASSGIGAATALTLATAGFPVALAARRTERCESLARQIRDSGGEAVAYRLDLTDPDSVSAFAKQAGADLGPIEVVVSNAGAVAPGVGTCRHSSALLSVEGEQFISEPLFPNCFVSKGYV